MECPERGAEEARRGRCSDPSKVQCIHAARFRSALLGCIAWIVSTSSFVSLDTESPRGLPEEPNCMKDTKFSTSGLHEWSARVIPNVNVQHEWSARYQMSMFSTSGLQILYCRGLFHDDLLLRCHNAGPSIPTASDSSIGVTMSLPLPSSCHKGRS